MTVAAVAPISIILEVLIWASFVEGKEEVIYIKGWSVLYSDGQFGLVGAYVTPLAGG